MTTGKVKDRKAILILVAYHTSPNQVKQLGLCLSRLSKDIGYAVVVNDYQAGEAIDLLSKEADLFLANSDNPGYGKAVNQAVKSLREKDCLAKYIVALNTDLEWQVGCFEVLLNWMDAHPEVVLSVPQLLDELGNTQRLCKRNPTVLGLLSRRFIPGRFKPDWLRNYDNWYIMADRDYNAVFDVPYLSGCCMLIKASEFCQIGGFDERFFLYLEDADLTRRMAEVGRAVHLPVASLIHHWGRGSHYSKRLTLVNLHSAWIYFRKWGLSCY
jgi:GT2 family glycosyltransferase